LIFFLAFLPSFIFFGEGIPDTALFTQWHQPMLSQMLLQRQIGLVRSDDSTSCRSGCLCHLTFEFEPSQYIPHPSLYLFGKTHHRHCLGSTAPQFEAGRRQTVQFSTNKDTAPSCLLPPPRPHLPPALRVALELSP
jgi:hypothetical protein